mmetsp:Transcript_23024/g.22769  ORF Transcript_23024/g.22769 Transcript_23024/m.22769 type:complete len:161 (+) Transcript_23024:19-501(+)
MAQTGIKLRDCIRSCEETWVEETKQEASRGNVEAQITYAQMLIRGVGGMRQNINLGIQYLRTAAKKSAEASIKLGKIYLKGKIVRQDLNEAYFYLRLVTLYKCKCGSFADEYHANRVSNVHLCYPTEALEYLRQLPNDPMAEQRFRDQFAAWRDNKSIHR